MPANSTIADQALERVADSDPDMLFDIFVNLARSIAPRVNRKAIIDRTPEARLSGRLFDYDDVVQKFLSDRSIEFYEKVRIVWKWNSRYWEQLSLAHLASYYHFSSTDLDAAKIALDKAVQHARNAVSIEYHPFSLSTLGKVLMTSMAAEEGARAGSLFTEAFKRLSKAIELEASWSRSAVQPYASLFRGTLQYVRRGGSLNGRQKDQLAIIISNAEERLPNDLEISDLLPEIYTLVHGGESITI